MEGWRDREMGGEGVGGWVGGWEGKGGGENEGERERMLGGRYKELENECVSKRDKERGEREEERREGVGKGAVGMRIWVDKRKLAFVCSAG